MTRDEEIEKEAHRISQNVDEYHSFIQGAEWADETMLNKVCEYLYQSNRDEMAKMGRSARLINVTEFRKKMAL